ncbi:GNAT family N-acetyltransferase [Clostridium neuense]|uniref:GNAT family N-acetyltransferase n=1 Tax=Clostridium neuense TaxID=1728934 RepID=A0ABW8TCC4_9CLOT
MIRKGKPQDIDSIMSIIKAAIKDMESKNIHQWDEIYPDKTVLNEDLANGNLYVNVEDDIINAIVVLNEEQAEEYKALNWKYNFRKQLVIHRLCVDPRAQGGGIARKLLKYSDEFAVKGGYGAIRLDAFTQNERALRLYEKNGYEKVGSVQFRKGEFYCYEKNVE